MDESSNTMEKNFTQKSNHVDHNIKLDFLNVDVCGVDIFIISVRSRGIKV